MKVGAQKAEAAVRSVLTTVQKDEPEAENIARVVAAVVPGAGSVPAIEALGEALVARALAALNGADAAVGASGLNIAFDQTEIANVKALALSVKSLISPTSQAAVAKS
ncbi:MAG TPA: hypothetical protein VFC21_09675 [Bryobacteraceae bacterium]|nr:hypothetical protein [Bryobacteraceae bacterium]